MNALVETYRRFAARSRVALVLAVLPALGASAKEEIVYRLSPFDRVSVSVYGEPDLSTVQLVSDDGKIFVPLLGEVAVGGSTVAEASKRIERAFVEEEYLRRPVVTISIEAFAPKLITVLGEVNKPGSVEIPPGRNGLPIQIAVAQAGGFTGTAKTTDVTVTRADPGAAPLAAGEDGVAAATEVVNVDKILQTRAGDGAEPACVVRPDDVVFVPRRVF